MSKRLLEVREYNFEGGVKLTVELDRRNKKCSFISFESAYDGYKPQQFLFAGRELAYMNGWLNILSAMRYVIEDAKKEMESWETEDTEKLIRLLAATQGEPS